MRDFLSMVFAKADLIIKSKGVFYTPDGAMDPTPVAFHPEHYGAGLASHHPFDVDYGNIDPMTGEYATLTHHPAGHNGGRHVEKGGIGGFQHAFGNGSRVLWPIEAVVKGIVDFIEEKGHGTDMYGNDLSGMNANGVTQAYDFAEWCVKQAVDLFNQRHEDPSHHLPPVVVNDGMGNLMLNPEWTQATMGSFPKMGDGQGVVSSSQMPTRDANGKLITFYLNSGTSFGEVERGHFPESGAVPFYAELKEVLNANLGRGMSMDFVHQPYIEPHMMNPKMSRELEGKQGLRTLTPEQERMMAEDSHYGAVAPEMLVAHHPDIFFHASRKGGRPSREATLLLQNYNEALGLGLNEAQIKSAASAPIAQLMTPGMKVSDQGAYMKLYDVLGQRSGLHPGRAAPFRVWRRDKEGTPEQLEAAYSEYKQDPTQWELGVGEQSDIHSKHRGHSRRHSGEGYGQGTIAHSRNALALLGGAHELGVDLNTVWNQHAAENNLATMVAGEPNHTFAQTNRAVWQQIANHRIANTPGLGELSNVDFERGHPQQAMMEPRIPQDWQSVPSQHVLAAHASVAPSDTEVAPAAEPMTGQTTLDDWLVQRSPPKPTYSESEIRLLKAMEDIQLADARQKPEVKKMLPRKKLNLENYDDVLLLAKRLDITYGDVHAIYNAQGDWANLAQRLSISPTVVDSVKVAFGE